MNKYIIICWFLSLWSLLHYLFYLYYLFIIFKVFRFQQKTLLLLRCFNPYHQIFCRISSSLFRWFSKILHKTEFVRKSLAVTSRSAILKISYFCLVMNFLKKYQIWNYQIFSDNRKAILSRCTIHLQAFVVISGHCRMVPKTLTFYTLFVSQNSYLIVW